MKILMITARFPHPPRKGDQALPFYRIREMASRHNITLVSLSHTAVPSESIARLQDWCSQVHIVRTSTLHSLVNTARSVFSPEPLQLGYFASRKLVHTVIRLVREQQFDVAHAYTLRMAPYLKIAHAAGVPTTFLDLIDSMSLNFQRRLATAPPYLKPLLREELRRVRRYEANLQNHFTGTIVVGTQDAALLGSATVIPLAVCLNQFSPRHKLRQKGRIILSGNMAYTPNVEAATWFAHQVFPLVRQQQPDTEFWIVGVNPALPVRRLEATPGIRVLGSVADMAETLNTAEVAVAPMQSGSGIQFKILEAMACGVPVITTNLGLGSLLAKPNRHLTVADSPEEFAQQVVNLLRDQQKREQLGAEGRKFVAEHHDWPQHVASLEMLYLTATTTATAGRHQCDT